MTCTQGILSLQDISMQILSMKYVTNILVQNLNLCNMHGMF